MNNDINFDYPTNERDSNGNNESAVKERKFVAEEKKEMLPVIPNFLELAKNLAEKDKKKTPKEKKVRVKKEKKVKEKKVREKKVREKKVREKKPREKTSVGRKRAVKEESEAKKPKRTKKSISKEEKPKRKRKPKTLVNPKAIESKAKELNIDVNYLLKLKALTNDHIYNIFKK